MGGGTRTPHCSQCFSFKTHPLSFDPRSLEAVIQTVQLCNQIALLLACMVVRQWRGPRRASGDERPSHAIRPVLKSGVVAQVSRPQRLAPKSCMRDYPCGLPLGTSLAGRDPARSTRDRLGISMPSTATTGLAHKLCVPELWGGAAGHRTIILLPPPGRWGRIQTHLNKDPRSGDEDGDGCCRERP